MSATPKERNTLPLSGREKIIAQAPYRVLVVDDMETNRLLIKGMLQPSRYMVAEATDGRGALSLLASQQFDVVVLDVMLPDIDGFEVCKTIRSNPDLHLLPVIMLTTLDSPDSLVRGMEAGATDYISKSFNSVELTAKVAAAAEKKRTTDRLDDTESVLFALARMVEAKDETTGNHCDRLSYMAMVFGHELGLDYDDLDALRRGGVLHDIGKLGIPDSILFKQGTLDEEEWNLMRRHSEIGASLCAPLRTMRKTRDVVRFHHEKWDGSGYPFGLKGEKIPFLARVFQIVDVYDALASERPYKPAWPQQKIIEVMKEETARGLWDPELMARFMEIVLSRPELLIKPDEVELDRSARIFEDIAQSGALEWYRMPRTEREARGNEDAAGADNT